MAICPFMPGFPQARPAGFACYARVLCTILVQWGSIHGLSHLPCSAWCSRWCSVSRLGCMRAL